MNKYFLKLLVIINILLIVIPACNDNYIAYAKKNRHGHRHRHKYTLSTYPQAVWMYNFKNLDNENTIEDLVNMNMTHVYVGILINELDSTKPEFDSNYLTKVRDFINQAEQDYINVHGIIMQNNTWTYTAKHYIAIGRAVSYLNYCEENQDRSFAGFQIDIEPYTLPEWKLQPGETINTPVVIERRNALINQYVALLQEIHETIEDRETTHPNCIANIEVSAATAWWYNEKYEQGYLENSGAEILAQYIDVAIPMCYGGTLGDTLEEIINCVDDELELAPTIIGIGATQLAPYSNILETVEDLNDLFGAGEYYKGISIFKYSTLKTLMDE